MQRRGVWHIEGDILMQAVLLVALSILRGELGEEKTPHLSSKFPFATFRFPVRHSNPCDC